MTKVDLAATLAQLHAQGAVVLRDACPKSALVGLQRSAQACFDAIEAGETQEPARLYRFTPFSYSVLLAALLDFGIHSHNALLAPLKAAGVDAWAAEAIGGEPTCNLEQSWVRKRYAPSRAPRHYQPNTWHQDGGLGASFGPESDPAIPLTQLMTCWIPLQACGRDCPGLEFVRVPLKALLHYTELDDSLLRQRFRSKQFWAPELEPGDALVFLAGTLHRTYVRPEMHNHRLSLEYRLFPTIAPPLED